MMRRYNSCRRCSMRRWRFSSRSPALFSRCDCSRARCGACQSSSSTLTESMSTTMQVIKQLHTQRKLTERQLEKLTLVIRALTSMDGMQGTMRSVNLISQRQHEPGPPPHNGHTGQRLRRRRRSSNGWTVSRQRNSDMAGLTGLNQQQLANRAVSHASRKNVRS